MANNLTGDFDAIVEVSIRQINGLLATLHQSALNEDAPLPLLHSGSLRIGDVPQKPPLTGDFGDWVLEYQRARGPVGLKDLHTHLTTNAPPGASKVIADLFTKFGEAEIPDPPPDTVRGRARVQLSPLTLSLPPGSTSEVIVHAFGRAHYYPDPGTTDLPQPLHGEVQATFEVRQTESSAGRRLLIRPSSQDSKIQFTPAPGTSLSAGDAARISVEVRKAIREHFPLTPVDDLPADFPAFGFKGLGSGPGQAIALPLQLSGTAPPAGAIHSVNNLFIGPSGFAFAVGREFIKARFQPTLDRLMQFKKDIPIKPLGVPITTYKVSVTSATIEPANGSIDLTIKAKAMPTGLGPKFPNIVVKQRLRLVLFLETLFIRAPDDELTITGLLNFAIRRIRPEIVAERDRALPTAQDALNTQLSAARTKFNTALHKLDPASSASLRAGHSEEPNAAASGAVAITPDGVIVRGDIGSTAARHAPIIKIEETDQGQSFTALNSWIPGGRITQFRWSWVEYTSPSIWSGVLKISQPQPHRFLFPKPAGITDVSRMCLRLLGTQTSPQGDDSFVVGGSFCHLPDLGQVLEAPSWMEPVTVPVWLPGITADVTLKEVIAGHVSVQADTPRKNELSHNFLVYFADWRADKPLEVLGKALGQMRRKGFSLVVIAVLPAGAFDSRRREVEARLDSILERFPARLELTEDHEGGWTRTFAVSKTPSAYLMNARREFVWKHEGEPDPAVLAGALDEHLVPSPAPRARPLGLAVAPGERAPDVLFGDDRGNHLRLSRLRGRAVLLNFWQSWSIPSLKELDRLERLHKEGGRQAPFIVACHGGKERKTVGEIRKQYGFSFVLTHDAEQRIARRYGVRCWPTTISVNADGRIDQVQFGITHEREVPPKGEGAEAY